MRTNLAPRLEVAVVESQAGIAALGHPERRRLLAALAEKPDSAAGLAERLGDSRQRVNYHVRALEAAELIELAEERPRRGLTERIYRPVGRRFAVDPSILGTLDAGASPAASGDPWAAAYAIALASRATREVAALRDKAVREGRRLAIASIDTTVRLRRPRAMRAFVDDLARTLAEVVARHDDPAPDARPFRVTACSYPAPDAAGSAPLDPQED